jgi:ubiquinone/menaquinone biosynthesis C-methylase UbiE
MIQEKHQSWGPPDRPDRADRRLVWTQDDLELNACFRRLDQTRYSQCPRLLQMLNTVPLEGKRVLEIGVADGCDSEQLIRRGAIWSGVALDRESLYRVERRFKLRSLHYERLFWGTAEHLPCQDGVFDLVFSHGALSRIAQLTSVQNEIARVLKPDGELIAVLYAKWSLCYLLSLLDSLRRKNSRATTEYVYDVPKIRHAFHLFALERTQKMVLVSSAASSTTLRNIPVESLLGWWLWAQLRRKV